MAPEGDRTLLAELVAMWEEGDEEGALETARRVYAAFLRGEISLDDPVVDPGLRWEPPTEAPTAGEYRGAAAAHDEVASWTEPFDDFRWEPTQVTFGEDVVVIAGEMSGRGRGSGVEVRAEEWHVWTLRDGRIARMQMFLDRDQALAAAGLSPGP